MKYIFLINGFTVKDRLEELKDKIILACNKYNLDYVIEINDRKYSTEDILKKYKKSKHIIMAVGGDGMINRVLQSIVNTENILGIIPYGTGNDLYKSIVKFQDEYNKCDIVKINDKYFINVACFGIDADVANSKDDIKCKLIPKSWRYIISLIKTFFKYKNRAFHIKINDKNITDKFATIAVCNGSYYGNGFMIGPTSNLTDGNLEVYIARDINKLSMLKLILKMHGGQHENSKKIKKLITNKLHIQSKNLVKCNIDGDILEAKEFNIEVIKNCIIIYYNQNLVNEIIK